MILALALSIFMCPCVVLESKSPEITISLSSPTESGCQLNIKNHTEASIQVWRAGFWPNHSLSLFSTDGKPARLSKLGEKGKEAFGTPGRDKNAPVTIKAGSEWSYTTPPLTMAYDLEPGEYLLIVTYSDDSFGKPLALRSNKIKVIVTR